jgi:hypothetical protein
VTRNDSKVNLLGSNASAPHLQHQAAAIKPADQTTADFPTDFRLEKQSDSNQGDLFRFVHKKMYADGRMGKWVDVAAGYGQVCGLESGLRKDSVELEQPGCAYLKASFSF